MKQYIGTKIVQAEPANRFWFENGEKMVVPDSEDTPNRVREATAGEKGYKGVYPPDGYESWSPKDVFEAAYRETTSMSFGLAIEAAKMGKKIARKGWNGKGMFLFLATDIEFHTEADLSCVSDLEGDLTLPAFVMKTADDHFCVGWLASQTDMLADDWKIVE